MDSTLIEVLDSTGMGIGTFLTCIIGIGCLIFGAYKLIKKYNNAISEQALEKAEEKNLEESIESLTSSINNIKDQIDDLCKNQTAKQDEIQKNIESLKSSIEKTREENRAKDEILNNHLNQNEKAITDLSRQIEVVDDKTNLLIESDKEGIKSTITNIYYESIKNSYIEIYKLQSLEAIYEKYLQENGNTFIGGLMSELRAMPHTPPKPKTRKNNTKSEPTEE